MRPLLLIVGVVVAVALIVLLVPGAHTFIESRVFSWVASSAR